MSPETVAIGTEVRVRSAPIGAVPLPAALDVLREQFDLITGAHDWRRKLQHLVRTLAVTGRLVPQLGGDEDARVLLARLTGREPEPVSESVPRDLPPSWLWCRFTDVATIESHLVPPSGFLDLPHVAPDNIEKGTGRLLEYRTVREDGVISSNHRFFPGQIVYSKIRPNLSKAVLVNFEGLCSADMYPLRPAIHGPYLHLFLLSSLFLDQVVRDDNRVAMPKVNQEQLSKTIVAVPPLAEQKRIVAKVDQLMTLCDDLEARQAKKRETSTRLTKSALEALTTAEGPEEFDVAWKRVVDNFDVLIDRSEKVEQLRTVVLSVSARGGLVQRMTRRSDPDPRGTLPEGWRWLRVDEVGEAKLGKMRSPQHHQGPHMRPYLRVANVLEGRIDVSDVRSMNFPPSDAERFSLKSGDILLNEGQSVEFVGRPAIYRDEVPGACFQKTLIRFRCFPIVLPEFALLVFRAYMRTGRFQGAAVQTTNMAHLPLMRLVGIEFPVPPLHSQDRVVKSAERLMKVCDELELRLTRAEERGSRLVTAVVQDLLA